MTQPVHYHYTTIASASSVLSNRSVWITHCQFLNDAHELTKGWQQFCTQAGVGEASVWAWVHILKKRFYCVMSLSKRHDVLSQWRAYAGDGTGAAIGFSAEFLSHVGLSVVECVYDNHDEFITNLIDERTDFISEFNSQYQNKSSINEYWSWCDDRMSDFDLLIRELLRLKNPAFKEELEVRGIKHFPLSSARWRERDGLMIPFQEVRYWPHDDDVSASFCATPEVWLGPKCDRRNKLALELLNYDFMKIQQYDCGYL